ncbi:MAG: hypothetical protein LBK95_04890 [Bifidobacteriaceae bacterium]|jgi:plasmid stability protein|nr:hypothetical protein [Bifidobacteriaceae bacterium]
MSSLQVRDLPPDVHDILKRRAAKNGQSLSAYVRAQLEQMAHTLTIEEHWEQVHQHGYFDMEPSGTEIIRAERDARS